MKIYVASSWRNDLQPEVVDALRSHGHEVYDFHHPSMGPGVRGVGFHWSDIDPDWATWTPEKFREALKDDVARDGFASDLIGMQWADAFVLVMPCGRSAHLELGWAIGAGKPSIILLSDGEPELMYGLVTHLCTSMAEVFKALAIERSEACLPGCVPYLISGQNVIVHIEECAKWVDDEETES